MFFFSFLYCISNSPKKLYYTNDPRYISRPCSGADIDTIDCIREFFSKNSRCEKSKGPLPSSVYVKKLTYQLPHSNTTADIFDANLSGLENMDIAEFYINNATNKLVFAIEVPYIKLESEKVVMKYNRKCKESIERSDRATCHYGPAMLTIIFPSTTELRLSEAKIFSYVLSPDVVYELGPGATAKLAAGEMKQFQAIVDNIPLSLQEVFVSLGSVLMTNFMQMYVCDFSFEN